MDVPALAEVLNWLIYFLAGSGLCSAASSVTPSNSKNTFAQWLIDGMNLWAFNVGKGENKDEKR